MQALGFNPLHCLDCNLERDPAGLDLDERLIEDIAHWRNLYDAIDQLWLDSGDYEEWAEREMADLDSSVNREGRTVQARLNQRHRCYYYVFEAEQGRATQCPLCGADLTLRGVWKLCEPCSLVLPSDYLKVPPL
jgi:predicted  nucleic acid-binding Zn ribbon protein